ncbi:ABC transporter permease [Propylenella binzhouense]|uniref:ABC transporter permease n=1 Tax=Propylenella binzhouense TaxID=2555902 RepID=A0A964T4I3_9HYPH|nr:ABC transporter permease [Propylenella binzhouense]MYZ48040.1 ABC transporter permease [Propylenella binzhouense]
MLKLILRRLAQMMLIMVAVSLILFGVFDSPKFKRQLAVNELGGFAVQTLSPADYQAWLERKGLNVPFAERYWKWLTGIARGDFGRSFQKSADVGPLLGRALLNTGKLALCVFVIMIPLALVTGVMAGIREGSFQDRSISFLAVLFTSIPEIATAIFLTVIFALWLGWFPAKSRGDGLEFLVLPALTLVLYDFGYVARLTRASVAEVMQSQYVRTAILKGLPYRRVVIRHVLRNALIAPFTVIVLQLNWILSGVVVVEVFFQYNGFGKLLLDAALFGDLYVVQAATLAAVLVAVLSQLISDIGYVLLNPRIRFG